LLSENEWDGNRSTFVQALQMTYVIGPFSSGSLSRGNMVFADRHDNFSGAPDVFDKRLIDQRPAELKMVEGNDGRVATKSPITLLRAMYRMYGMPHAQGCARLHPK